jgi:hypothetical protein
MAKASGIQVQIRIEGHERLSALFNSLEPKLQKKIIRPGLRAGAKIIKAARGSGAIG